MEENTDPIIVTAPDSVVLFDPTSPPEPLVTLTDLKQSFFTVVLCSLHDLHCSTFNYLS